MITRYIVVTPTISPRGVLTGVASLWLQTDRLINAVVALSNAGSEIVDLDELRVTKDGVNWAPLDDRYGRRAIMLSSRPGTIE